MGNEIGVVPMAMKDGSSVREEARSRVRELGYWIAGHADQLTREMDEVTVAKDGVIVNADVGPDGVTSVKVVKNYILINR